MKSMIITSENPELMSYLEIKKTMKKWSIFELRMAVVHGSTSEVRDAAYFILKQKGETVGVRDW